MFMQTATIQNEQGFHVRPAQLVASASGQYAAAVRIKTEDGRTADARSMLDLMTLGLEKGMTVLVEAEGDGEKEAVTALCQLIESKFGEA